jgi:hypothetical protein
MAWLEGGGGDGIEQIEEDCTLLLGLMTWSHCWGFHDGVDDHSEDLLDTEHLHDIHHHQLYRIQSVRYEFEVNIENLMHLISALFRKGTI